MNFERIFHQSVTTIVIVSIFLSIDVRPLSVPYRVFQPINLSVAHRETQSYRIHIRSAIGRVQLRKRQRFGQVETLPRCPTNPFWQAT